MNSDLIKWLLAGDPAVLYQTSRDLLEKSDEEVKALQNNLPHQEGYVKTYLDHRDPVTGLWGGGLYTPKWTSTHYTLLELKALGLAGEHPAFQESAGLLLEGLWYNKGHIRKDRDQDLCVIGMLGGIVCHAKLQDPKINEMVDYILEHGQEDGGYNCGWTRSKVSSVHTTLTMLEFFQDYLDNGYRYRRKELIDRVKPAQEYLLDRNLYRRKTTGKPIQGQTVKMPYPSRYKYDFLRALDYFQKAKYPYDERLEPALRLLEKKRNKDGSWPITGRHGGEEFFVVEAGQKSSRMNTLRALRVLKQYPNE